MIEILGNLFTEYVEPILHFAGCYVDPTGVLRPSNTDEEEGYLYEGKKVIVVKNDIEFARIRDKKDELEVFSPFVVPKHAVFLANLVKYKLNELVEPIKQKTVGFTYDEDLDEFIMSDDTPDESSNDDLTNIGLFQAKAPNGAVRISYSYIDNSDNAVEEYVTFDGPEPILAFYGAALNAVKKHISVLPIHLRDTELAVNKIYMGLIKYEKERQRTHFEPTGFQGIDMVDNDEDRQVADYFENIEFDIDFLTHRALVMFPWNAREMNLENPDSPAWHWEHVLFPPWEKETEEETKENDMWNIDMSKWDDLVLI